MTIYTRSIICQTHLALPQTTAHSKLSPSSFFGMRFRTFSTFNENGGFNNYYKKRLSEDLIRKSNILDRTEIPRLKPIRAFTITGSCLLFKYACDAYEPLMDVSLVTLKVMVLSGGMVWLIRDFFKTMKEREDYISKLEEIRHIAAEAAARLEVYEIKENFYTTLEAEKDLAHLKEQIPENSKPLN